MWTHECIMSGLTATESNQPCNWCNVAEEDVQSEEENKLHDKLEPVHE